VLRDRDDRRSLVATLKPFFGGAVGVSDRAQQNTASGSPEPHTELKLGLLTVWGVRALAKCPRFTTKVTPLES
jgi:hypothetical protein